MTIILLITPSLCNGTETKREFTKTWEELWEETLSKCDQDQEKAKNRFCANWPDKCTYDATPGFTCDLVPADKEPDPIKPPSMLKALSSDCPCPGGLEIKQNGCKYHITCKVGGDHDAYFEADVPCPSIKGTDPQYPLVKMLSGTLIEWDKGVSSSFHEGVSDGAPDGIENSAMLGAEIFDGIKYTLVASSVDLGKGAIFNVQAANAIKNSKNILDRDNFKIELVGGNPNVTVLKQKDIYEAYKNRTKYVQAYLVLAGKGYGERPWPTYEEYVKGICKMSDNPSRCRKSLSYKNHQDTEMMGNYYLGNANSTIIGLYSEVSSHNCHGATVLTPEGPAFGIKIRSTWCFYVHASWDKYLVWETTKLEPTGKCCKKGSYYYVICIAQDPHTGEMGPMLCERCEEIQHYQEVREWVNHGGGQSSGDCGACYTAEGYVTPEGIMKTDPYPISFYQSQPLLIK